MKLYGLEKLSLVDYDGHVAATTFTGACNFRCGFCHNGPLVDSVDKLETFDEDYILSYLKKRKGILDALCITGGEPTLNSDLPQFCEKIKEIGYKIKIDTNGTNPDMIKTLAENGLADYFAMDIKNDKEDYAEIIGFKTYDTAKIEKSVNYFLSGKTPYEFRTTLIKEYHKKENIRKIGEWIKGADKYFLQKYKDTETCLTHLLHGVEKETAEEFISILSPFINKVSLRGY